MPLAQFENIQKNHCKLEDSTAKVIEEIDLTCEDEMPCPTIKKKIVPRHKKAKPSDSCLERAQIENISNAKTILQAKYQKDFSADSDPHQTSDLVIEELIRGDQNGEESKKALQFYLGLWETEKFERRQQNRKKKALQRAKETAERRKLRREKDKFAKAALRAKESLDKRVKRREKDRIAKALSRMRETEEQRRIRLEKNRIAMATLRAAQSDEEKSIRRERDRINKAKTRAVETEEQRRIRREKNRIAMAIKRANLSSQERNCKKKVSCVTKAALKVCL